MKIIIIDDSINESNNLKLALEYCLNKLDIKSKIDIYNEVDSHIDFNQYDLIFLDVEIKDHNGLEIGAQIRKVNKTVPIILTTNYKQYAIDGYRIKADRYFLKPIDKHELLIELKDLFKDIINNSMYYYDDKLSFERIYYKNILYIEVINHKSILHLINQKNLESNKALREWMELLDDYNFVQVNKSFYVNLKHIASFNIHELKMTNGDNIDISRHYRPDFEKTFNAYVVGGI